MVLQWDDSLSWVKPDINTTLSQHRMNYKFDEISPFAYGNNEGKFDLTAPLVKLM